MLNPLMSGMLVGTSAILPDVNPTTSQLAAECDAAGRYVEHVTADRVEHDIGECAAGKTGDLLAKPDVSENDGIRAGEGGDTLGLGCAAGAGDDLGPSARARSQAARPTPPLAPCTSTSWPDLRARQFDQTRVGSGVSRAHRGGSGKVHAARHRSELIGGNAGKLGKSAGLVPAHHAVASSKSARRIGVQHFAGEFQSADERHVRFELIAPLRHGQVGKVERRRAHLHQHVAGCADRGRKVGKGYAGEIVRQALNPEGLHRPRNCPSPPAVPQRFVGRVSAPPGHHCRIIGAQERVGGKLAS